MNILYQKIKLSFGEPQYFFTKSSKTGQETVVCKLPVMPQLPVVEARNNAYGMEPVYEMMSNLSCHDMDFLLPTPFFMTAKATVSKNDVYSKEKGMKIALAKAESAAYTKCANILNANYTKLTDGLYEALKDFCDKTNRVVGHNDEYINKLTE